MLDKKDTPLIITLDAFNLDKVQNVIKFIESLELTDDQITEYNSIIS